MRRLYVELAVPDELADGAEHIGVAELVELLLADGVDIKQAQWHDPAQFVQVDGGVYCATLAEALEQATYKVSFTLHNTGERVRLVRYAASNVFVLCPFVDEFRAALVEKGVPADAAASLAGMVTGWEQDVIDRAPEGAVAGEAMPLDDT